MCALTYEDWCAGSFARLLGRMLVVEMVARAYMTGESVASRPGMYVMTSLDAPLPVL